MLMGAFAAPLLAHDQVPAGETPPPFALTNATIHTVSDGVIENGTIVIAEGKIQAVGAGVRHRAEVIDCTGKHIYPGLFEADTDLGLVEIGAVRATRDQREAGSVNPSVESRVAVNPDSELIPTIRANGILLANVLPQGGIVSGRGAVMQLDGWTYEQMTVLPTSGIVMNWPSMLPRGRDDEGEQRRRRTERLQAIDDLFDLARSYTESESPEYDARFEAMKPLLSGEVPLLIRADGSADIAAAVAFAARQEVRAVILGGRGALAVADLLVEQNVPVILNGTQRSPNTRDSAIDSAFTLPRDLIDRGVVVAIGADRAASFARNLPYHAASAAAYGLDPNEALATITLRPAQILGVADRLGSLEVGKDATLFIADGDIFEVPTQVEAAWIAGRPVDLSSKHTELYEKYKQRLAQQPGS
jgi:imidazolonepropionase-like amidohydrolase